MNTSPQAIHDFRDVTNKQKPALNFPKTRDCPFCGKSETRTLMQHNRCRDCNKARPSTMKAADKYPKRTRNKLAAMAQAEAIMQDLGKFTVADIMVSTGFSKSTVRVYIDTMQLDGRVIKLREAFSGSVPALYTYGSALVLSDDDDDDKMVRPIRTRWIAGNVCRDALVSALFGATGRATA